MALRQVKILCTCVNKLPYSTTVTVVCDVVLCISSTLLLQLVLFILLLNILSFTGELSVHCFTATNIYTVLCAFNDMWHSFTLNYLNIEGYVSSVMLWKVNDSNILFVYFVSHCNEPLCVGEYIQLSLCASGVDICKISL